jgi:hypothetical protein
VAKSFGRVYVSSKKHWSGRKWLSNTITNKWHNTLICHFETLIFGEFYLFFTFFVADMSPTFFCFATKKRWTRGSS